ncbi:hypothetical protein ACIPL1_01380 [Pseudomonas sp. NPDC090202]|uniref:hypothetical protein n=1 Tax=Pseudomonas sp. NPDC090202 TaxID=3364476 RepID=UPI00381E7359
MLITPFLRLGDGNKRPLAVRLTGESARKFGTAGHQEESGRDTNHGHFRQLGSLL